VRAKRRGLPRQYSITLPKVAERDGWMCMLCGTPVDRSLHHSHPMAASLDHVVPLNLPANTKHGHVWNNVQLAHRHCNESKGCSVACWSLLESDSPRDAIRSRCIDQQPNQRSGHALAEESKRNSKTRARQAGPPPGWGKLKNSHSVQSPMPPSLE
jgi:hypothetical protein